MNAVLDDNAIRLNGIEALNKALGHSGALRFLALIHRNPTDYVEISRKLYEGQTVDEIFDRAAEQTEPSPPTPITYKNSNCPAMKALKFPLDREGTLHFDGNEHSTGLFDRNSGLYVPITPYSLDIPADAAIVLLADDGGQIEIERISACPSGEAHYHFVAE